ncbi:hypothetical protein BV898_02220 [Hypsibius exemplaris]|uniref:tRNA-intron lyase n=1 Tax=Hypsibius exemplaris TaxID=2072580 RepID=A0A1W0X9C6_HYPEX|nr:hypothetical protein BV898_02220 [Hypsibius exemplaris]
MATKSSIDVELGSSSSQDEDLPTAKRPKREEQTSEEPPRRKITINIGARGTLHVWDAEDAVKMQSVYHVMGTTVGCFAKTPLQDIFKSLPFQLTPAEAAYLRDIGAAQFVDEAVLRKFPTAVQQEAFREQREKQFNDQHKEFDKARQFQLDERKEQIMAGKIRKMTEAAAVSGIPLNLPEDREELWQTIRNELLSRPMVQEGSARIELPFRSWKVDMSLAELEEITFSYPQTHPERVYYAAYLELMKAGFWVTSGMKYGGDLLLYEGDVHVNHSTCIVRIVDETEETSLEDILRIGRVATACHKAVLWASVRKDYTVDFTCSKWSLMK